MSSGPTGDATTREIRLDVTRFRVTSHVSENRNEPPADTVLDEIAHVAPIAIVVVPATLASVPDPSNLKDVVPVISTSEHH